MSIWTSIKAAGTTGWNWVKTHKVETAGIATSVGLGAATGIYAHNRNKTADKADAAEKLMGSCPTPPPAPTAPTKDESPANE